MCVCVCIVHFVMCAREREESGSRRKRDASVMSLAGKKCVSERGSQSVGEKVGERTSH